MFLFWDGEEELMSLRNLESSSFHSLHRQEALMYRNSHDSEQCGKTSVTTHALGHTGVLKWRNLMKIIRMGKTSYSVQQNPLEKNAPCLISVVKNCHAVSKYCVLVTLHTRKALERRDVGRAFVNQSYLGHKWELTIKKALLKWKECGNFWSLNKPSCTWPTLHC